jgi:hypothetical protein
MPGKWDCEVKSFGIADYSNVPPNKHYKRLFLAKFVSFTLIETKRQTLPEKNVYSVH